jgi:hypothetical protein
MSVRQCASAHYTLESEETLNVWAFVRFYCGANIAIGGGEDLYWS